MSSSPTPPPFQEADRCDVCHCTFTAFRRRHHCRCCGRTLCHDHSSYFMALPQFGILLNVRVCYDCFNNSSRSEKAGTDTASDDIVSTADEISSLNIADDVIKKPGISFECKCGMPLCICEAPKADAAPPQKIVLPSSNSNPRPKKAIAAQQPESALKKPSSSSAIKSSSFLGQGNISMDKPPIDYDVSGEGLREAIKNGDVVAVKKLLSEGVDANYCDKQGMTLLHLAALFNQTEIVFVLMENGANVECKNAQGETPLDCAPTMLQYKMQNKLEEMLKNFEDN